MSDDLIRRSDAIKAVWGDDINPSEDGMVFEAQSHIDRDIRLSPSADGPTVIRIKTIMKKEDYDNLEKRIKQQNPNVIVIPHNAELVTPADRPQGEWIDADAIKDKAWKAESEACFYALEDVVSVTDIDEAPSIDICFCKECKKANTKDCSTSWYDDDWGVWRIGYEGDDWFCADGEREGE